MYQNANKVHKMTLTAILVAIIFLLTFTPLGYLVIGPIAATTIQMPVIIGAVLMGPLYGAVLGGFFGLSAIVKVLTLPGADPFATLALTYSPAQYLVVCLGARILMGWLSGALAVLLGKLSHKLSAAPDKDSLNTQTEKPRNALAKIRVFLAKARAPLSYGVTGFLGSLMNTVFYLGLLWMLCAQVIATYYGVDLSGVGNLVMDTAVAAGLPEAVVSCVVVTAVCKALERAMKGRA